MFLEAFRPYPSVTSKMFGLEHLLYIIIGFPLIILIGYLLRNSSENRKKIIYRIIGVVSISLDPIYWIWERIAFGKINFKTSLPLYFCSIFFFCAFIFAFTKKGSKVNHICCNYICTMNIICGLFGIIFSPYFSKYPAYHFVVVRSMIYHYIMLLLPTIIYFNKDFTRVKNDYITFIIPALFMFVLAFLVDMIKIKEGWDYCYFNGAKGVKPLDYFLMKMNPILRLITLISFFFVSTNLFFTLPQMLYKHLKEKKENRIIQNLEYK